MTIPCPFGFRLVGPATGDRRLVEWQVAFAAYAAADPRCEPDHEAYLSTFTFGGDFQERADSWGIVPTAGFGGPCWAPWLWFDIDRTGDLDQALQEARRLALFLDGRYQLQSEDDLLLFLSGNKGFHAGLPTSLWCPEPTVDFHRVARHFAVRLAELAEIGVYNPKLGYRIDEGVYVKVQPFRAPNSKHPKSGRYKRRLSFDELMNLSAERILQLAVRPEPFDIPTREYRSEQAVKDWAAAIVEVAQEAETRQRRQAEGDGKPTLNKLTREFISNGASEGDRHRLLFSAAANMAEFSCVEALAEALLAAPGLDSGLSPSDVARQIRCGLAHGRQRSADPSEPPPQDDQASDKQNIHAALAAAWASQRTPTEPTPSVPPAVPGPQPSETALPARVDSDLQTQLLALWDETTAPQAASEVQEPPDTPELTVEDLAELQAEREALQEEGRPRGTVTPPATARLFFADEQSRACPPARASTWTWEGADRWYHVTDYPIPLGSRGEEKT
jgi:hypothetical protein